MSPTTLIKTTTTDQQRVQAGAEWLDEEWPGWETMVDQSTLRLSDICNCVLGQLYERPAKHLSPGGNGYGYAVNHFFEGSNSQARKLGFTTASSFSSLDKYWKEEIQKRLSSAE